jgi:predicted dehydrogenase
MPGVGDVDIASRREVARDELPSQWQGTVYGDYAEALDKSQADMVYVSLVNSLHTEALLALAEAHGVCVAEATVFADHPQFGLLDKVLGKALSRRRIVAVFSTPPFEPDNFRYRPDLGGGALLDLGPYAAALSRVVQSEQPTEVHCRVLARHPATEVETAFQVSAVYPDGGNMVGQFGFDTEYQNQLLVYAKGVAVQFDRAFTTPPDLCNELVVDENNQRRIIRADPGDAFVVFLDRFIHGVQTRSWSRLTLAMVEDARFRDAMASSAGRT